MYAHQMTDFITEKPNETGQTFFLYKPSFLKQAPISYASQDCFIQ